MPLFFTRTLKLPKNYAAGNNLANAHNGARYVNLLYSQTYVRERHFACSE